MQVVQGEGLLGLAKISRSSSNVLHAERASLVPGYRALDLMSYNFDANERETVTLEPHEQVVRGPLLAESVVVEAGRYKGIVFIRVRK